MEEEEESKSISSRPEKKQGAKRASRKEPAKIEDDEIPF